MKKIFFTAIALVAVVSASVAKTIEVKDVEVIVLQNQANQILKEGQAKPKAAYPFTGSCMSQAVQAYQEMIEFCTEGQANAYADSIYSDCINGNN